MRKENYTAVETENKKCQTCREVEEVAKDMGRRLTKTWKQSTHSSK